MTKQALKDAVKAATPAATTPAEQIMEMTQGSSHNTKPVKKPIHVMLRGSTLEELTEIAEGNGISRNSLIDIVLTDYVNGAFTEDNRGSVSNYFRSMSVN